MIKLEPEEDKQNEGCQLLIILEPVHDICHGIVHVDNIKGNENS